MSSFDVDTRLGLLSARLQSFENNVSDLQHRLLRSVVFLALSRATTLQEFDDAAQHLSDVLRVAIDEMRAPLLDEGERQ